MSIFENFEKKLQAEPKSIVFTEGTDARILSAASRLLAGKTLKVILLGEVAAVKKAAADGSFDITDAEIIDPANYEGFEGDKDLNYIHASNQYQDFAAKLRFCGEFLDRFGLPVLDEALQADALNYYDQVLQDD